MAIQVVTSTGVHLSVSGLARAVLDAFVCQHPAPVPPDKEVTLYGGFKDTVPDTDDPDYQQAVIAHAVGFVVGQLELVAPGVLVADDYNAFSLYRDLVAAGVIVPDDKLDFLKFVALATDADTELVAEALFYLSTTTERGIAEAQALFNITWLTLELEKVHIPRTPARFSRYFEDRQAARFGGYTWDAFCSLDGPAQSAVVAHYRAATHVEYLTQEWVNRKK